jgi:hypothetical protein
MACHRMAGVVPPPPHTHTHAGQALSTLIVGELSCTHVLSVSTHRHHHSPLWLISIMCHCAPSNNSHHHSVIDVHMCTSARGDTVTHGLTSAAVVAGGGVSHHLDKGVETHLPTHCGGGDLGGRWHVIAWLMLPLASPPHTHTYIHRHALMWSNPRDKSSCNTLL